MSDYYYSNDLSNQDEVSEQPAPEIMDVEPDQDISFALETDRQVQDAAEQLRDIKEINQENWIAMDTSDRLSVLQSIESRMAAIQGRPAVEVTPIELEPGSFGYFDGQGIALNSSDLAGDQMDVREFADTIVHEGRHAYQSYAIQNPGFVQNQEVVNAWEANLLPGNYLRAEDYGQEAYLSQSIEADAWSYADQVTSAIFGSRLEKT